MANDYQNYMSGDTLAIDTIANEDASRVTPENFAASESYIKGGFGMLPGVSVPLDTVLERQAFFRQEIERSMRVGPDLPFMDDDRIRDSYAVHSQERMLKAYIAEANQIPKAEQGYNLFAPLANMAAQSIVKADTVGAEIGVTTTTNVADRLDAKDKSALRGATQAEGLEARDSVALKGRQLGVRRGELRAASRELAAVLNDQVISKLNDEISKATSEKDAIQAKIDKVVRWIGYAETGASLIAGGAGALKAPAAAAEAAESAADTTMDTVEAMAGHAETGAGVLGTVVGAGMQLYYADQFRALDATISRAKMEIEDWQMASAASNLEAKQLRLQAANDGYRLAVEEYSAAIEGRRAEMARIGAAADKKIDRRGRDQDVSQTMLWMNAVLEAQTFMASALQAGNDAKGDIDATYTMIQHDRSPYSDSGRWYRVEDIWENGSQTEGTDGADFQAVARMRILTENWLKSGGEMKAELDSAAGSGGEISATMGAAGYTGSY